MKFKQLTYHDRQNIESMFNKGYSKKEIAAFIGCDLSTIYRELKRGAYMKRNSDYTEYCSYSADIAQHDNNRKESNKGSGVKITYSMSEYIRRTISRKWSVRTLVGYARKNDIPISSYSAVYSYIRKGLVSGVNEEAILKYKRKYHHVKTAKRGSLFPSISSRPHEVDSRQVFGHWELDTVIGKQTGKEQVLLVLTERKTRYELVRKLYDKTAASVTDALNDIVHSCKDIFRTITCDNGTEFSDYHSMSKLSDIYYCHAYSSWERGSNENANKLIRKVYPKGTDFSVIKSRHAQMLQDYINHYPRGIFNYECSETLFVKECDKLHVNTDAIIKHLNGLDSVEGKICN